MSTQHTSTGTSKKPTRRAGGSQVALPTRSVHHSDSLHDISHLGQQIKAIDQRHRIPLSISSLSMVSPDDVPKWAQLVATPHIEDGFEPSEKVDTQTEDSVPGVGHVDYESWEMRTQTNRLDIEYEDVSNLPSQNYKS